MVTQKLIKFLILLAAINLCNFSAIGQSKAELEKKRKQKEKEIELTKKLLAETNEKQKESIGYLATLTSQIKSREELISTISKEVKYLDESISDNEDVISSLRKDIEDLKLEYEKMLVFAYKNRNTYSKIGFILSAETFNQSYKRMKLLQSYSEYRKKQIDLINETKEAIEDKNEELLAQKNSKMKLLAKQQKEKDALQEDITKQSDLVATLKKKGAQLEKDLAAQQKAADDLKKQISNLIKSSNSLTTLSPADRKLSLDFANNRTKLPWPVEKGYISRNFGHYTHELTGGDMVCNGIKFRTPQGAEARAVFNGKVSNIISIPGAGKSILVKHGEYFTVYSNLSEVYVSPDDEVSTKQKLGKIRYNSKDGTTEMELQIWKSSTLMNPTYWILPR